MTTFRERIIGLARSLKISREDFNVGPFIDWPGIQKRIEERFIIKTHSDLQPAEWPLHFKGKQQVIRSRTFEPYEYLDELLPEDEKVWLLLPDIASNSTKLWLFQGYVKPIHKVLSMLPKSPFYLIAKKYEWLLFNDQEDAFIGLGDPGKLNLPGQPPAEELPEVP
jgi:hypothetical protein